MTSISHGFDDIPFLFSALTMVEIIVACQCFTVFDISLVVLFFVGGVHCKISAL